MDDQPHSITSFRVRLRIPRGKPATRVRLPGKETAGGSLTMGEGSLYNTGCGLNMIMQCPSVVINNQGNELEIQ